MIRRTVWEWSFGPLCLQGIYPQYICLTSRRALQYAPNQHVWIVLVLSSMTGSMLLRRTDENLVDEVIEENVELTKEVTKR